MAKKVLILLATAALIYSVLTRQITITFLALGLGIYLEKQELFKDWDAQRKQRMQERIVSTQKRREE
ncbi:hypothetical protein [Streptococcus merionis]|uniref:Uncharacterized protein n=1 Tax=Streptococcus merionis TaxID=400065 RepID=A0A239T0A3_9STRE|nr:hypothetical protein [Streptococcus merionis]SNU91171.1 Uncharacterised protein [Streptococcus merionis]